MSYGPTSTTTGPWSTDEGPTTGTALITGLHGLHMGITLPYGGPTTEFLDKAENLGAGWIRWGIEIRDYYSTPDSTSSAGTLDLSPVAADIAAVHARSAPDGSPMRVMLAVLGVTRSVNSNSGSADPASGGEGHWFAIADNGRTLAQNRAIVETWTVSVANLLDPTLDILQLGNELNNGSFNHDGSSNPGPGAVGASAATVAAQMAGQILAVRASGPSGLTIAAGSVMNYGDWRNATDIATGTTAPAWIDAMISGDARLKGTGTDARPDLWTHHNYVNFTTTEPLDGITITAGDLAITSGFGWGTSQMLQFRARLIANGVTDPAGDEPKIDITEYGASYTGTGFSQATQLDHTQQHLFLMEVGHQAGWLPRSFYYTVDDTDAKSLFTGNATSTSTDAGDYWRTFANTSESTPVLNPPVASFTATPASVTLGTGTSFHDTSTNTPTSWAWDFGDGTLSTSQNPSHTFATAGTFTVTLIATNADGADTATLNYTVNPVVTPPPPPASPITVVVEIGTPPTPINFPTGFVPGDPIRGIVGGPYVYPPDYVWQPITGDVQSVSIRRGRSRDLDRTEAGTAQIVVQNSRTDRGTAGDYDPFAWSSPYFPYLGPRSRIRVSVDGGYVFGGDISDMPVNDVTDNVVVTTFNCVDIMARLNKTIRYRPEAQHSAEKRIARILERAGWNDHSFLIPGLAINTYQMGTVQEGTALDMIQDVAFAEGGMAYVSNQGDSLNFITREHMRAGSGWTLSDNPQAALRYSAVTRNAGLDILYNVITATANTESVLTNDALQGSATDPQSIGIYGERPLEFTCPFQGNDGSGRIDDDATKFLLKRRAQELLSTYKDPELRFESVTVPAARYTATQRRLYLTGQELGHVLTVERTPPGTNNYGFSGTVLTRLCVVQGMDIDITDGARACSVTFTLSNRLP